MLKSKCTLPARDVCVCVGVLCNVVCAGAVCGSSGDWVELKGHVCVGGRGRWLNGSKPTHTVTLMRRGGGGGRRSGGAEKNREREKEIS